MSGQFGCLPLFSFFTVSLSNAQLAYLMLRQIEKGTVNGIINDFSSFFNSRGFNGALTGFNLPFIDEQEGGAGLICEPPLKGLVNFSHNYLGLILLFFCFFTKKQHSYFHKIIKLFRIKDLSKMFFVFCVFCFFLEPLRKISHF